MKRPVAVVVMAVWMLAACGSGSHTETDHPDGVSAGQAIDHDREGPAAPIEGAVAGGTVTVLSESHNSESLDPTDVYYDVEAVSILRGLVTRSLTQFVYDPAQQTTVLVPDVATDTGTPNEDFTEWTFTIRDGVRFENGKEVTADDVAFGIKRSFDRRNFPHGPSYSNEYFLDGDSYRGPYWSGTEYPGVVVDGNTVTLKMGRPFADLPYFAAYPAIGPIRERGSDPATYSRHPLATGPYKVADYSPGKSLTLVRNPYWDPATDPGRHAYPDRYVFDFTVPDERIEATILGDSKLAQTTLTYDSLSADAYPRAQELRRVTRGPGPCTYWWSPDNRKITDIRVRRAIGYAFPYKVAAEARGFTLGVTFLPGESILPPNFPGRRDYSVLDTAPGRSDPDKAKSLLQQAGYAPGEYELSWPYNSSDPTVIATTRALATALEAAGFKAKPFPAPNGDAAYAVYLDPNAPINLRSEGWCPDWPSGGAVFPRMFHSESGWSHAYFAEPAVDAEIERISELPIDAQPAAWVALDQTIMTDYYPVIVTGYDLIAMLHGSKIGGMNDDSTVGMPTWKDIHVIQ